MTPAASAAHAQSADALVLFGATGDLAYKKIFPALYAMCQRDLNALKGPVIGVASSAWSVEQLRTRVHESIQQIGGEIDSAALERLLAALQYVSGTPTQAPSRRYDLSYAVRDTQRFTWPFLQPCSPP